MRPRPRPGRQARLLVCRLAPAWLVTGCSGTSSFGQATPITPAPTRVPAEGGDGSRVPSVIGSLSRQGEALLEESRRQRRALAGTGPAAL